MSPASIVITVRLNALELRRLVPDLDNRRSAFDIFMPRAKQPFVTYHPLAATLWIVDDEAWVILESGEQIPVSPPGEAWTHVSLLTYQQLLARCGEVACFSTADVVPDYAAAWHELNKDPKQVLVHPSNLVDLQAYLTAVTQGLKARA